MAKSKKSKKQERKRKSRTLILLLFLTIIMFGTSTYAWFTANKVVTINSINVNVQASDGIQISTDGENWKSVIMNSDITTGAYEGNKNQLPQTITNVSTDGAVDQTAGTLKMYGATIDNDATTGDYNIVTTKETESAGTLGKFVAFEVKNEKVKLSKLQEHWLKKFREADGIAYKVQSLDEVKEIIKSL